jgi:hypothetical protein
MAMVPVHARPVTLRDRSLSLGTDVVVYVGGPPERGIDFAVAAPKRALFVLLPQAHETTEFGMAALRVADPPTTDVPAIWSLYPNGLDPAPSAATPPSASGVAFVARVRPRSNEPGAPRVLELGRLEENGAFIPLGIIADARRVTDITMTVDAFGSVWILYGDTTITWLERRVCP